MYVSFSASTGLLTSSHYRMGWSFKLDGGAPLLNLSSLQSLPQPKPDMRSRTTRILASVSLAFVALVLLASAGAYGAYRYENREVIEPWELDYGPHRYKYSELKHASDATRGFREREFLGCGGFGKVYGGVLPGTQSIGRLRHRNLVELQGWCRRRTRRTGCPRASHHGPRRRHGGGQRAR
jgi:hypothetical protein